MKQESKKKIYVLAGPTASGKSSIGMELARKYPFEIVSMDSMQIYRGMDIGTAKPTKEEREEIRHHMIDAVEPDTPFSCADYVKAAGVCVDGIISRGKMPLFVGGTGLYLDGLLYRNSYGEYEKSEEDGQYRRELMDLAEEKGADFLHEMLEKADPEAAEKIHKNNVKRVVRALEIIRETGKTKTEADRESRREEGPYEAKVVILSYPEREILYERINRRVDGMISEGLLSEVRALYGSGLLTNGSTAAAAIGYKEFIPYLEGKTTLAEATELLKQSTRRYAKRQVTWFSRYKEAVHIDMCMQKEKEFKFFVNCCEEAFFKGI